MHLTKYTKHALKAVLRSSQFSSYRVLAQTKDVASHLYLNRNISLNAISSPRGKANPSSMQVDWYRKNFHTTAIVGDVESQEERDKNPPPDSEAGTAEAAGTGTKGETDKEEEEKVSVEDELRAKVAELQESEKDMKDNYVRSLAEIENVRTIAKRDVENATTYAATKFAKSMLEVADNLGRALEAVPEDELEMNETLKSFHEGVVMTEDGLQKAFNNHGITKFGDVGEVFDPVLHSALFQMDPPSPNFEPNTIGQVMLHGYTFKDRVLRPANVGTVKKE